jgi:hypothetical protein
MNVRKKSCKPSKIRSRSTGRCRKKSCKPSKIRSRSIGSCRKKIFVKKHNYKENSYSAGKRKREGEFSAYEKNADTVKQMVDDDNLQITKTFFKKLGINYEENIEKILPELIKNLSRYEFLIIPTRVRFLEKKYPIEIKDNFHAVCLVLFKGVIYFFDPNGVTQDPKYSFVYDKKEFLSTKEYLKKFDLSNKIVYIKQEGPQIFSTSSKSKYINNGGYCMFYNYLFIENLIEKYKNHELTHQYIKDIFEYQYDTGMMGIFPTNNLIGKRSKQIIDEIF